MKYGQKVYIPSINEVGTIEEIKGKRISKVKVKDKIVDVFFLAVENWDLITKIGVFILRLFGKK